MKQVDTDLKLNIPTERQDWEKTLLEKVFEDHLNEAVVKSFTEKLGEELEAALKLQWFEAAHKAEREVAGTWEKMSLRGSSVGVAEFTTEMDDASKVGIVGLTATATSTAVLAAGWHTLAWSVTGLFLPLLPVVIAATLGTAWLRKDKALEKLLKTVGEQENKFRQSVEQDIRYRMRLEVDRGNRETATRAKEKVFRKAIGNFTPSLLNQLMRGLEDHLDNLALKSGDENTSTASMGQDQWLARAKKTLETNDELAAGMYGALAFEQLLHGINRKREMAFNFRMPHHNRAFIDRLAEDNRVPKDQIHLLRSLKHRRDMFTHRMHHVIAMPDGQRGRMVSRFIRDLEKVWV